MKIVNYWGSLYKITDKNYKLYLLEGMKMNGDVEVGIFGHYIGQITFHALDAEAHDFQDELERVERQK